MKIDLCFFPGSDLADNVDQLRQSESLGFDAAWIAEEAHNPFFSLTLAAKQTSKLNFGTYNAHAFLRSPMITAQIAWDLSRQSVGRFALGLCAEYSGYPGQLTSGEKTDAAAKMREYVESLYAIWDTFQNGARLRYRGAHYQFRLMAPFFNPGPIAHPDIPIYLRATDPDICTLAGELCHGLHLPILNSRLYLQEMILPALKTGLLRAGRKRQDVSLAVPLLLVSDTDEESFQQSMRAAKTRIALEILNTDSRHIMEFHGWEDIQRALRQQASAGNVDELWQLVSDDMLRTIAVVGDATQMAKEIISRYAEDADRISLVWGRQDLSAISVVVKVLREALQ